MKPGARRSRIIHGDCIEAMQKLPSRCARLVVADPPYFNKRYKDKNARRRHLELGKYATNLWRIPSLKGNSSEKAGHPSQKPEELIDRIIRSSSAEGDLVIDPFLGSGTTAVVAKRNRRRWIGIEENADYVKIARERIAQL